MNDPAPVDPTLRREEAGTFLRSRRERLAPAALGLPAGGRRRTPGLRREEVASLAGVGTTWYTWLEQGRDVHPSDAVLDAIAGALRLDATERRHLLRLFERPAPDPPASRSVSAPLRRMLDGMTGQPATVIGRYWDLLAWNRAADAVFGSYAGLEGEARNALHLLFADGEHRRRLLDWEALARSTLAMFRADCAMHAGDPGFERLVGSLIGRSPEFARWWSEREVAGPILGRKRLLHPVAGRLAFEFASFAVDGAPGSRLVVFTPLDDGATAAGLASLLRTGSTG